MSDSKIQPAPKSQPGTVKEVSPPPLKSNTAPAADQGASLAQHHDSVAAHVTTPSPETLDQDPVRVRLALESAREELHAAAGPLNRSAVLGELMAHVERLGQLRRDLELAHEAFVNANQGWTSTSRAVASAIVEDDLHSFATKAQDPEFLMAWPYAERLARLRQQEAALTQPGGILERFAKGESVTLAPGDDAVASDILSAQHPDRTPWTECLATVAHAIDQRHLDDARQLLFRAAAPSLKQPNAAGESILQTKPGHPSLTAVLNEMSLSGHLESEGLFLSPKDLERYVNSGAFATATDALAEAIDTLGTAKKPAPSASAGARKDFVSRQLLNEAQRIKPLWDELKGETRAGLEGQHSGLLEVLNRRKPGLVSNLLTGIGEIVDRPEVVAAAPIAGVSFNVIVPRVLGRLANAQRLFSSVAHTGQTLRPSQVALSFAATHAVGGAAIHAGMNGFNLVRGMDADWSVESFGQTALMSAVSMGLRAQSAARANAFTDTKAKVALEKTRNFVEEAAALSAVGLGFQYIHNGNLEGAEALTKRNFEFLFGLRLMAFTSSAFASTHEARVQNFNALESEFRTSFDAYSMHPNPEALLKAHGALEKYTREIYRAAKELHEAGLTTSPDVKLRAQAAAAQRALREDVQFDVVPQSAGDAAAVTAKMAARMTEAGPPTALTKRQLELLEERFEEMKQAIEHGQPVPMGQDSPTLRELSRLDEGKAQQRQIDAHGIPDTHAAVKGPLSERISEAVEPHGYYRPWERLKDVLLGPKQSEEDSRLVLRQEVWRMYLGLPMRSKVLSVSPHKPPDATGDAIYFKLELEPEARARWIQTVRSQVQEGTSRVLLDNAFRVMGNYTASVGRDPDGRLYVSARDRWDLDIPLNSFSKALPDSLYSGLTKAGLPLIQEVNEVPSVRLEKVFGKPVEFYWKEYVDE